MENKGKVIASYMLLLWSNVFWAGSGSDLKWDKIVCRLSRRDKHDLIRVTNYDLMMKRSKRIAIYSVKFVYGMETDVNPSNSTKLYINQRPKPFDNLLSPVGGNMTSVVV